MKKRNIILIAVVAVIVIIAGWGITSYNGLVNKQVAVENQWANVESKLQRRMELIPNLVESVKGSMKQEQEVFNNIADARKEMAGASTVSETSAANTQMESALSRLLVVMENYPEITSNENVKTLMTQLEGTENRISVERDRYNTAVKEYNASIRRFPSNIMAGIMGLEKENFFEADEGAETAPSVDFSK